MANIHHNSKRLTEKPGLNSNTKLYAHAAFAVLES
jgi:hypothetical protein